MKPHQLGLGKSLFVNYLIVLEILINMDIKRMRNLHLQKHNLTFPFGIGTRTKLLYHSVISSMHSGMMVSSF